MMGHCEASVKDYAALEAIDPLHSDVESLYPYAMTCAQSLAEGSAAEARKDWQACLFVVKQAAPPPPSPMTTSIRHRHFITRSMYLECVINM